MATPAQLGGFVRRKYLVAPHLQNPMLRMSLRHAGYMLFLVALCLFLPPLTALAKGTITSTTAAEWSADIAQVFRSYWPAFLLGLVTVFCDAVIVSHRMGGPLYRIRGAIEKAAEGEIPPAIKLRKKDYLHREADTLNALFAYTAQLKAEVEELRGQLDQRDPVTADYEVAAPVETGPPV